MKNRLQLNSLLSKYIKQQSYNQFNQQSNHNDQNCSQSIPHNRQQQIQISHDRQQQISDYDFQQMIGSSWKSQYHQYNSKLEHSVDNPSLDNSQISQKISHSLKKQKDQFYSNTQSTKQYKNQTRNILLEKYSSKSQRKQFSQNKYHTKTPKINQNHHKKKTNQQHKNFNPLNSAQLIDQNVKETLVQDITLLHSDLNTKKIDELLAKNGLKSSRNMGITSAKAEINNILKYLQQGKLPDKYLDQFKNSLK